MSNRRPVVLFWLYVGILCLIALLAYLRRIPGLITAIPYYDLAGHFILMGAAAYLGHRAFGKPAVLLFGWRVPLVPSIVTLVVGLEEILQALSPNRTSSLSDFAADLSGILLACLLSVRADAGRAALRRAWARVVRAFR